MYIIVFIDTFIYKTTTTAYQIGYVKDGKYGSDSNDCRTYNMYAPDRTNININTPLFTDILTNQTPYLPIAAVISNWIVSNEATSTTVNIRNSTNNAYTLMEPGHWYMGVK